MSTPLPDIHAALAARLASITPSLPTAWPNTLFNPDGDPYQEAFIIPARSGARDLKTGAIYSGIYQVNICYPADTGVDDAEARAKLVCDYFSPSSAPIDYGTGVLRIVRAPYWTDVEMRPGFYCLAVTIEFEAIF